MYSHMSNLEFKPVNTQAWGNTPPCPLPPPQPPFRCTTGGDKVSSKYPCVCFISMTVTVKKKVQTYVIGGT